MKKKYTTKILGAKGLLDKEIKEYYGRLKDLRSSINSDSPSTQAQENLFELTGGLRFFYQEWISNVKPYNITPKKLIFVFHEAYGSSDIFFPLADVLGKEGFLIIGLDYRGHGRTGGQAGGHLGDIDNFDNIIDDYTSLISSYEEKFDLPIIFIGYDIGALIALKLAAKHPPKNLEGLIFISPIIQLKDRLKHAFLYPALTIGKLFSKGNPVQPIIPEKMEKTYYREYQEYAQNNPLRLKEMSLRMFKAILQLIRQSKRLNKKINSPCMILQGTKDTLVDVFAVHNFYNNWSHPNKKIRLYENAGHNLLMDKFTNEIYEEIRLFINSI
ncbi:alpha/beta fold hydrolase [Candidatus Lokiarchaeum ossiferum]|uniref:alpha/beta fold hydrolase n=1 Tax=Candidatus Lokiarchaeum ossiferum TaxID=2951803 RepID=UPI00352C59EB